LKPQSSYVYYRWGQLLEAKGQLQEAAAKYRLALLFQPKRVTWQSDIDRVGGSVPPDKAPKLSAHRAATI
jgi:tetratricopeptide (TPR) repeat protein